MLILGDEGHYHGRFPWVTQALVTICVAVYTAQAFLGEPFTNGLSLVPAEITEFRDLTKTEYAKVAVPLRGGGHTYQSFPVQHYRGPTPIVLTFFTSMFLHAGLMHLIGNMWFLVVFGRNVECALGHGRFLAFYLFCGTMAGAAHVVSDPHSVIPCLGASGAISGVLGAYVAIHPFNKVKVHVGYGYVIEMPALIVIGIWFVLQYISAFVALEDPGQAGHVAYWAHLGGFVTGLVMIFAIITYLKVRVAQEQSAAGDVASVHPETGVPAGAAAADPFSTCIPPPLKEDRH
jgi:membrane associated rhomboid family serine protease